jgi:predicted nucleic acid-binding protein
MTMAGKVHNLAKSPRLPPSIALDTNIVINAFMAQLSPRRVGTTEVQEAQWIVGQAIQGSTTCYLMPSVMNELLHLFIGWSYRRDVPAILPNKPNATWGEAFKNQPTRVRQYAKQFRPLASAFTAAGLYIEDGFKLPLIPTSSSFDELSKYVERLALLTADAQLVVDSVRAGVDGIATQDRDLKRASQEIDIYTWN